MPLLYALSDTIAVPGTNGQQTWVTIVADRDYYLLELALLPGAGAAANIAGLIGILSSQADAPSGTGKGNGPNTFSSTNSVLPIQYRQLFGGRPNLNPPLVTMQGVVDVDYSTLMAAIPMGHPPIIQRGEVLVFAIKNLTTTAYNAQWAVKAIPISNASRDLILRMESKPIIVGDGSGAAPLMP